MKRPIGRWRGLAAGVLVRIGACFALACAAQSASAGSIVVAPNANAATAGSDEQFGVFDNVATTFQFVYSATQFITITTGSEITGIGFRLAAGFSTVSSVDSISSFSLQIGMSTAPPGALSATFATNQGSDTVTALSGPLTIPAGSFVGGAGPNPFYELVFSTPYTYTGGNLLVTMRQSGGTQIGLDANGLGLLAGLADTVESLGSSTATSGQEGFFNAPVAAFYVSPAAVPEPSAFFMIATGLPLALGFCHWRRRRAGA